MKAIQAINHWLYCAALALAAVACGAEDDHVGPPDELPACAADGDDSDCPRLGYTVDEYGQAEQALAVATIAPTMGFVSNTTDGTVYYDAPHVGSAILPDKGPLRIRRANILTGGVTYPAELQAAYDLAILQVAGVMGIPLQSVTSGEDVLISIGAPPPPSDSTFGLFHPAASPGVSITPAPNGPRRTYTRGDIVVYPINIQATVATTPGCYTVAPNVMFRFLVAATIVHEIGHALGLGHASPTSFKAMSTTLPARQTASPATVAPFPGCPNFWVQSFVPDQLLFSATDQTAIKQYLANTNLPE